MNFLLSTWLQAMKRKAAIRERARQGAKRGRLRRAVPRLEALEDRWVPATLLVTSPLDDGSQGTLRYDIAHAQSGDTIEMSPTLTSPIVLTQGELYLKKNLTIEGQATQLDACGDRDPGSRRDATSQYRLTLCHHQDCPR